jgi:hypothetical protein
MEIEDTGASVFWFATGHGTPDKTLQVPAGRIGIVVDVDTGRLYISDPGPKEWSEIYTQRCNPDVVTAKVN